MAYTYAGLYQETFLAPRGALLKNTQVSVFLAGTTTLATLYTSHTKATPALNPFSTDAAGNGRFYADPGHYDLDYGDSTLPIVVHRDPDEPVSLDDLVETVATDADVTNAVAAHAALPDPHPGYLTPAEADAKVADHAGAGDPHPGYLTAAEAASAFEPVGAVAGHAGTPDPHPGYLTPAEADGIYAPASAVAAHEAVENPHPVYTTVGEVDQAITDHVAGAAFERQERRGAAGGYAGLDASALVPADQLGSGVPSAVTFLDGTRVWAALPSGGAVLLAPAGSHNQGASNTATERTLVAFDFAAGQLSAGDVVMFATSLTIQNTTAGDITCIFRAKLGATTVLQSDPIVVANGGTRKGTLDGHLAVVSATSERLAACLAFGAPTTGSWSGGGTLTIGEGAVGEDIATALRLDLTVQLSVASLGARCLSHGAHSALVKAPS
ncbi:MAG TPA: hypothetical protein VM938_10645 [Acidimicrobiales bacterium]|nr:hypothetical protein [Acidimicrobiales bacterium]